MGKMKKTFNLTDVETLEHGTDSEEEYYTSIQRAINSSMWGLQGFYGRSMMSAIESGKCMLGRESARDYYGNFIPSRSQVQEGTKGSLGFVKEHSGKDWADLVEKI